MTRVSRHMYPLSVPWPLSKAGYNICELAYKNNASSDKPQDMRYFGSV